MDLTALDIDSINSLHQLEKLLSEVEYKFTDIRVKIRIKMNTLKNSTSNYSFDNIPKNNEENIFFNKINNNNCKKIINNENTNEFERYNTDFINSISCDNNNMIKQIDIDSIKNNNIIIINEDNNNCVNNYQFIKPNIDSDINSIVKTNNNDYNNDDNNTNNNDDNNTNNNGNNNYDNNTNNNGNNNDDNNTNNNVNNNYDNNTNNNGNNNDDNNDYNNDDNNTNDNDDNNGSINNFKKSISVFSNTTNTTVLSDNKNLTTLSKISVSDRAKLFQKKIENENTIENVSFPIDEKNFGLKTTSNLSTDNDDKRKRTKSLGLISKNKTVDVFEKMDFRSILKKSPTTDKSTNIVESSNKLPNLAGSKDKINKFNMLFEQNSINSSSICSNTSSIKTPLNASNKSVDKSTNQMNSKSMDKTMIAVESLPVKSLEKSKLVINSTSNKFDSTFESSPLNTTNSFIKPPLNNAKSNLNFQSFYVENESQPFRPRSLTQNSRSFFQSLDSSNEAPIKSKVVFKPDNKLTKLLNWCQSTCQSYNKDIKLNDFSQSWSDGYALLTLINHFIPNKIDYFSYSPSTKSKNWTDAIKFATDAGVTELIEAEDMIKMIRPNPKVMSLFISTLWEHFNF